MANVVGFPNKLPFYQFLDELEQAYQEHRLKDFICIYRFDYRKGEESQGFNAGIEHYWFGEQSTLSLLGLTDVMKDEILKYMAEKCEEDNMGENQ